MTPPHTSRAAPIRTVTRKAWHAPTDRWQAKDSMGNCYTYGRKPKWYPRSAMWTPLHTWSRVSIGAEISAKSARSSLRRIITKPRRTAKGTR